ncbi:MobF family relaxase [Nocardia abscessus]|uniref:MobF family relaxase n=1 Tax=Nocardia abscessus TaxID=120957 RepID=UPI001E3B33DB|nr:MobF family relaxase [Nocardia abscessus]
MSPHRLSADAGVDYYTRCVAVHDGHERGRASLSDYYSDRGEVPGIWLGSGLVAFDDITAGDPVDEKQMAALYREGRHPNAEAIVAARLAAGDSAAAARKATQLGRPFYRFKVPEGSFRHVVAQQLEAWNVAAGQVEDAPVPKEVREEIRTRVGREMFTSEHGRAPHEGPELTDWMARHSRPERRAVAGFDLTFSAAKSVSAVWALAPREIAEKIEAAHAAAIADALGYLEKHGCYTRLGTDGIRQVDTEGMIATAFLHRDSRAGDPNLHTHVVVSNKVRTLDGRWRALDGRMVYQHAVTASEIYNARLEQHLGDAIGVRFTDRPARDPNKRPVREIAGIATELIELWSQRSTMIRAELATLTRQFQAKHGRAPIPAEVWKLAQVATLSTRARKHAPRALAEQRATWEQEAIGLLGSRHAVEELLTSTLAPGSLQLADVDEAWIEQTARRVVNTVAGHRATWKLNHIRAETERQLRGQVSTRQWAQVAERVVAVALAEPCSIPRGVPDPVPAVGVLRRRDGTSVYTTADSTLYTARAIVDAEQRLIAAAHRADGRTIPAAAVQLALVEFAANNHGRTLNPGQRALVEGFATSGARLQVAIAPAGTGKTTAMQVLTRAWTSEGGIVLGLAPTAAAAAVLGEEINAPTATIDMLTTLIDDPAAIFDPDSPAWLQRIDHRTLVIIDEAAKASTRQLDTAIRFLLARGASVRAIGDDQQLAAVAAGGVIRDIAHTTGALTLTQVMRFTDPGERAASLALREGDPAAIAHYVDHDRVHVGTIGAVVEGAFGAWAADIAAGRDAVLLAPTRDLVTELNTRARDARLARDPAAHTRPEVMLGDGLAASVGDVITTRKNAYRMRISATDHVRNGYRWTVRAVHADGRVTAAHIGSGRLITLPADYVADYTTLGYASTIDAAQGLTVDTAHTVLTGSESRQQAYVALTRGRHENHLYVATAHDGEDTAPETLDALHPPTALDVLTGILGRDGAQVSATTAQRHAEDPRTRLAHAAHAYTDALDVVTQQRTDPTVLERIDAAAEQLAPGLTSEPAYPTLRKQLSTLAVAGNDPVAVLTDAVARHQLDTAADRAAVLSWRIDLTSSRDGADDPLPWLPTVPAGLLADPEYGEHLRARAQQITGLVAEIDTAARAWTTSTAPMWAKPLVDTKPDLLSSLAVWRAVHDIPDNDRRLTGPEQRPGTLAHQSQAGFHYELARVLGDRDADVRRWHATATALDSRLTDDPYWPVLAAELTRAAATGLDVPATLRAAHDQRPLPLEQPAAALRWRMAEHLDEGHDHEFVDLLGELRSQELRALRDADLAREVTRRHNHLRYTNVRFGPDRLTLALRAREQLIEAHRRLDDQAADIRTAQTLERQNTEHTRDEAAARAAWRTACDDVAALRWWHSRQTRLDREQAAAAAEETLNQAADRRDATRAQLSEVRARIGAHESLWPRLLTEATDTAARDQALAEADREIAAGQHDRDRADAYRAQQRAWAQAPVDEQQRRAELPPDQLERENRARAEIHAQDNPLPSREEIAQQRAEQRRQQREAKRERQRERWDTPIFDNSPSRDTGYSL